MSNFIPGAGGGAGSGLLSGWTQGKTIGAFQAGSSFLDGLSGLSSARGDGATQAANARARASSEFIQAGEEQTQAGDEGVMAQGQITGLKNQYLNAIGSASARIGGSGVDVGQGIGQQQRQAIGQSAVDAGKTDLLASDIRARRDTVNAIQANSAGQQDLIAANLDTSEAAARGNMALIGGLLGGGLKLLTAGVH